MCVHPSAPPGFDFSIYMTGLHANLQMYQLIYMHRWSYSFITNSFIDGHSVLAEIMIHWVFDDKSLVVHASYKV